MVILTAENLHKAYSLRSTNDTVVLRGVSLNVAPGEYVALVGPSGAGKSTLLHILGGLDMPDQGEVCYQLDGQQQRLSQLDEAGRVWLRSYGIGFVFQFHHLLSEFTALENVMMPLLLRGERRRDAEAAAYAMLDAVGLGHRTDHAPAELSGGEQQRVALARALVIRPRILLADEPTGNLDSANTQQMLELIVALRAEYGLTVLMATHSPELARRADRVIVLRDGRITSEQQ
ncbi:MAG: lipoprotein-releasing system ATP-binding protein LolD [Candidatus Kapaibacterium sp.]|nr:MAG: lipoprotein-releasing system ATP-binding protein LolD [Candidatus Kapabacteria bacterium]